MLLFCKFQLDPIRILIVMSMTSYFKVLPLHGIFGRTEDPIDEVKDAVEHHRKRNTTKTGTSDEILKNMGRMMHQSHSNTTQ